MRVSIMRTSRREEDDLEALKRKCRLTGGLSQNAFATVPEYCISQTLRRNEGDSRGAAFVLS